MEFLVLQNSYYNKSYSLLFKSAHFSINKCNCAGPRHRQPLHLHAQHGQLLREQAAAADCRERRQRDTSSLKRAVPAADPFSP